MQQLRVGLYDEFRGRRKVDADLSGSTLETGILDDLPEQFAKIQQFLRS